MKQSKFVIKIIVTSLIILFFSGITLASDNDLFKQIQDLAERGSSDAQYHLGMMYNNGIGTKKDIKQAFYWFRKSAELGDVLAAFKLGCYYSGQCNDSVLVDKEKAIYYTQIAADAGYALAQQQIGAVRYEQKQYEDAINWWKLAAEQGDPLSLFYLSALYLEGKGIPKDIVLAYSYFKLSKLRSEGCVNPNAQSSLDKIKSEMTAEDYKKAEQLVSKYEAKPTPVTQRAKNGIEWAKKLIENF